MASSPYLLLGRWENFMAISFLRTGPWDHGLELPDYSDFIKLDVESERARVRVRERKKEEKERKKGRKRRNKI
jgi:hypothetical protein